MLSSITYKLTDLWLKSVSGIKIVGPIPLQSTLYQEMIRFRTIQNIARAPHLEETFQQHIEQGLKIDERSLHFAVVKANQIVACVRLTPIPFELSALAEEFDLQATKFHDYYEFSRLCTEVSLEKKGFYAGLLVVKAALHVFSKNLAKGIIGICKHDKTAYMHKLGLMIDPRAAYIPERKDHYQLIHATQDELISFYFNRFINNFFSTSNQPRPMEKTNEYRAVEKTS